MRLRTGLSGWISSVIILSVMGTAPHTHAQDCNALVAHGLRNIEIQKSSSAAVATKYYRNCGMKFSDLSDTVLAAVEVEVFGYGSGSGGFSRAQREQRLDQWCVTNREFAQSAQDEYVESQTIMAEALAAWSHCTQLASRGVHTEPRISGNQRVIDLSISNTGAGAIQFYGVTPTNFTCDTKVPSMTDAQVRSTLARGQPIPLGPAAVSVHCERKVATKTIGGQQYTWLEAATISVRTASDPYQLFFPEETLPPLPDAVAQRVENDLTILKRQVAPVGAIVGFVLKPEEIAALAPNWLPADGRTVSDALSPLNGRVLPDMNGRFLRGATPGEDASDNATMSKGTLHVDQSVQLRGDTSNLILGYCNSPDAEGRNKHPPNRYSAVWDTGSWEESCQHTHQLGAANLTMDLPEPPHRRVIFLVRTR